MVAAATTKMDEFGQECERKTLPDSNKVVVAVVTWSVQSPPQSSLWKLELENEEKTKQKLEISLSGDEECSTKGGSCT